MGKSKYPNKIDTSSELQVVRDNLTEINSDIINSLRSAIINIEQTLGINPQGTVGNTVSSRISQSLDSNGNILSSALSMANVLSGPITDNDVANLASISESKLKLNYPTTLLQEEISILNSQADVLQTLVDNLSAEIALHITANISNRHNAISINVEEKASIGEDIVSKNLEQASLQVALESIYDQHINYTGSLITEDNNSHKANQIFFDNTDTENIAGKDVQTAIEEIHNLEISTFSNILSATNTNSVQNSFKLQDSYEDVERGLILAPVLPSTTFSCTYVQAGGDSRTIFTPSSPIATNDTVNVFDILNMSGHSNSDDNGQYYISKITLNGSDEITSIEVFGGPKSSYVSGLSFFITKNQYQRTNIAGFYCSARPRTNATNTPDIQVLNPDCATIISSGINSTLITSSVNSIKITVDSGSPVTLSVYNISYQQQTVDSIVSELNNEFVSQKLNCLAYKIFVNGCEELAISHNIPNIVGDDLHRSIMIEAAASNDASSELGFSNQLGKFIYGSSKNPIIVNGKLLNEFGRILKFDSSQFQISTGSKNIILNSGSFSDYGVRIGDTLVLQNSSVSSDNGSYRVLSISASTLTIDHNTYNFAGSISIGSTYAYIIRNSANIGEMSFEEAAASENSILFDVFMDDSKDINYIKRLEIEGELNSAGFYAIISDVSDSFVNYSETAVLDIDTNGYATLTDPLLQAGESIYIATTGTHKVYSSDNLSFITINVFSTSLPAAPLTVNIYGFNEVHQSALKIARGCFSTNLGRVLGLPGSPGIPTIIRKFSKGSIGIDNISNKVIEKYIEGPRNEIRTSGIVSGCVASNQLFNVTYQTIDVSSGIVYVNGIRFEFPGVSRFRIDSTADYYLAIGSNGCLIADESKTDSVTLKQISPFINMEVANIAYVYNSSTNIIDIRENISKLDNKIKNKVIVSKNIKYGHFNDIEKAISYCKYFYTLHREYGTPELYISAGEYEINSQILIDFDILISGAGSSTILTKGSSFATGQPLSGSNFDMNTALFLIGGSVNSSSDDIIYGVSIKDLTYKTSSAITDIGSFAAISQEIDTAQRKNSVFRFSNLNIIGPNTMSFASLIGEYFIMLGQQDPLTKTPTSNLTIGNIIINSCMLNKVGLEHGAVVMTESASSTLKNFIATSNIATEMSPVELDSSFELLDYPSTPTLSDVVETSNIILVS